MGEALGGLILLAIVTNLPEIAITVSAALQHNLELAIGNILGGIAIQTVVLVVLDVFGLGNKDPLTYRAASLLLVLEVNGNYCSNIGGCGQLVEAFCYLHGCIVD